MAITGHSGELVCIILLFQRSFAVLRLVLDHYDSIDVIGSPLFRTSARVQETVTFVILPAVASFIHTNDG